MTDCLLQASDFSLNYYLGAQILGGTQENQTDELILVLFQVIR